MAGPTVALGGVVREVLLSDGVRPLALGGLAREVLISDGVRKLALAGLTREVLISTGSFPIGGFDLPPRRPPVPNEYQEDQTNWLQHHQYYVPVSIKIHPLVSWRFAAEFAEEPIYLLHAQVKYVPSITVVARVTLFVMT